MAEGSKLLGVAALALVVWSWSAIVAESGLGVNWGTVSLHKPSPSTVVDLLKFNNIQKVKLFDADPDVLKSLMGTGIQLMVGIPNEMLSLLSSSTVASDLWVRQNVSRYVVKGGVDIRYVAVGNEPFLASYSGEFQSYVVPALMNLQQSLAKANLAGVVKLVVPCVPPIDIYLFSLLDEGAKSIMPGNFERHWGIFSFDGQAKYPLNLGLGHRLLKNAKDVQYLPSRWCVANPSRDLSGVANHIRIACSVADCTTLNYGGSCNAIGAKGNISYAFNSYYQLQKQDSKSCDFDGLGMITFLDPSIGHCRFLVGVTGSNSSSSNLHSKLVIVWLWILWGFWIFVI
ncbi:hypothetical protein ACSBR2_016378 [Camellia fascicularis]